MAYHLEIKVAIKKTLKLCLLSSRYDVVCCVGSLGYHFAIGVMAMRADFVVVATNEMMLLRGVSNGSDQSIHSKRVDTKKKSTPKARILLPFLATVCTIAVTVISLCPPCRADQPVTVGNPPDEEISTPAVTTDEEDISAIERRKTEDKIVRAKAFGMAPHRQTYFLPVTYDSHPNTETYELANEDEPRNSEIKLQLSFKVLLWEKMFRANGDLFFAYTQRCFWQLCDVSSLFRENNYEPELFVRFDTDFDIFGLRNRLFLIGFNHHSNGKSGVLSRSWNRICAQFIAERGNFVIGLKPWYRIPQFEEDDNPDIEKYMGYGELFGAYRHKGHVFSFMFRNNLRRDENKGAVELGWSYPITQQVRVYVQYFNGYGESLVDYNDAANRIGVGLMLFDWI